MTRKEAIRKITSPGAGKTSQSGAGGWKSMYMQRAQAHYPIEKGGSAAVKGTAEYENRALQRYANEALKWLLSPSTIDNPSTFGVPGYLSSGEPYQHAQRVKKPAGKRSASWHDYSQLESQHGLKPNFLSAVEQVESNGNPWAIGPMTKYGQAKGAFQFMDATANEMGLRGGEVFDREKAAEAAAKYFAWLSQKYDGDPVKMLAAYNWGPGNLDKHGLAKMPDETRRYLEKILPLIGESGQLARIQQSNADSRVVTGGQQSRLVIDVALNQAPGSDINAQLRSNMPPPIIIPF